MSAASLLERCESVGIAVELGEKSFRVNGPPGTLSPDIKAELTQEKTGVRAILEAEVEFMALYRRVDALTDDGATPEQRAEAERLIHGELYEARQRYLELAGLL